MIFALLILGAAFSLDPGQCVPIDVIVANSFDTDTSVAEAFENQALAVSGFRDALSLRRPEITGFSRSALGDQGLGTSQIENQIGLRVSQRVLDFGDARRARTISRSSVRAANAELAAARADAARAAMLLVFEILEAEEHQAIVEKRLEYFQDRLDVVADLLAEGLATQSDLLQLQAEVSRARLDRTQRRLSIQSARRRLEAMTGDALSMACISPQMPNWFATAAAQPEGHSYRQYAWSDGPQLRAARNRVAELEEILVRSRRTRLPAVDVVGVVSYAYDDLRDDWSVRDRVGIEFSVPLYGAGRIQTEVDTNVARLRAAQRQLHALRLDHQAQLDQLVARQRFLSARQVTLEDLVRIETHRLSSIQGELEASLATLDDLIEAKLALEEAELDASEAGFEAERVRLEILVLTGAIPGIETNRDLSEFQRIWGWEPNPQD